MATESSEELFNKWLVKKLESLEIEDDVLVSYIGSVITTDDIDTDKNDVLKDIFQDLLAGTDTEALCSEILEEWSDCNTKAANLPKEEHNLDLGKKVSLIMEKNVQPILKQANRTEEEQKIREAILSRCNYISDEEEDAETEEVAVASSHSTSQNQNVEAVAQAEKEKREKMKSESDKKKAQDKVSREKQKQKADERKEKERKRTQKQERRR